MAAGNPYVADSRSAAFDRPRRIGFFRRFADRFAGYVLPRHPAATLALIDAAVRALPAAALPGPSPDDVVRLFGSPLPRDAGDVAWRCAALRLKNHAAIGLMRRHGLDALAALVDVQASGEPCEALRRAGPAIFVTAHVGVHSGPAAVFRRWGLDVLVLPVQDVVRPDGRAIALRQAFEVLRRGGSVLASIDGPLGANTEPVPCLGRAVLFRRGAFALARLARAPVRPIVVRWTAGGTIEPEVGAPLATPAADATQERALAAAAARWLEGYLRRRPEEAWPYTIANLLSAPSVGV